MDDDHMSVSSGSSDLYEPALPAATTDTQPVADAVTDASSPTPASPKRSLEASAGDDAPDKRIRIDDDREASRTVTPGLRSIADDLPTEIWQQVLAYLTPPELGRIAYVSKRMLSCLDGSLPANQRSHTQAGVLQTIDAETVWAAWRISHPEEAANMPKPLDGRSERDMWQLIRGIRCDVCSKLDTEPRKPISPDRWHGGPNMNTTRAVWSFAMRMCGECLYRHCEKDTAVLQNPEVRQFRNALPYAMVTHDFHYIPTTVLKEAGQAPSGLHVARQYFKPHIESIQEEWREALKLGQGAAEEWLKGLSGMGMHTANDSARWEHWEAKGGFNRVLFAFTQPQPAPLLQPTPTPGWVQNSMLGWPLQSVPPQQQQFGLPPGMSNALPPMTFAQHPSAPAMNTPFSQPPTQFSPQAPVQTQFAQPMQSMVPPQNGAQTAQQRLGRDPRDAEGAKAARRQQIEQRCLTEMDPPIPPNVLRHMPSFRAAIQIGFPLNDSSWETLKPKLLEQYEAALATEHETTRQLLAVQQQVQAENRRQVNSQRNNEPKDTQESAWDEKLRPQRERLGAIADDYVQKNWRGGQSVNSGNVARFALSIFDHVRKTFYEELQATDQMTMAMRLPIPQDPPDGPFLRRLTLETMKWVYDHKIRPLTRDYGKEIFFCNGAGCEFTNKHFAFEGVIQHYGAKHTNDYSKGNVIVHWQTAEWPEDLPFYDPGSGPTRPHINGGYSRGTTISPQGISGAPYAVPALATSPFGATPQSTYGNGPFTPPVVNGFQLYAQPPHQGYGQFQTTAAASQPTPSGGSDSTDLSQFFKTASTSMPAKPAAPDTVAKAALDKQAEDQLSGIMALLQAKSVQPNGSGLANAPPEGKKLSFMDSDMTDYQVYQDQLKFVAETARFAWSHTNAIDGMPSSVRVFAVLQYTVLQFSQRFKSKLSIDMFSAALTNSPVLEPLKHANGLLCSHCHARDGMDPNVLTTELDLKALMDHFKTTHAGNLAGELSGLASHSWVQDMIALPQPETVVQLINAPGMTESKLTILAEAFPGSLPRRMPQVKNWNVTPEAKQGKRNKRGRKASNGRRHDLDDGNNGDTEDGFRSSRSPPDMNGSRRKSPGVYGDEDDEEYDPSKPALPSGGSQRRRGDFNRKHSGMGKDLAQMMAEANEISNRAAAEENARRGRLAPSRAEPPPAGAAHQEPALPHYLRVAQPSSRPDSASRPTHASANEHDYGGYPSAERSHLAYTEGYHPERTASRSARILREAYDDRYASGTPPSGRKSRYARYDEQREQITRDRTRSRSPIRYDDGPYGERPAMRQREYLAPEQAPTHYRYVDEPPEEVFIDAYGRRLVRERAAPPPPAGYVVQRRSPGEVEYIDHRALPYEQRYLAQPPPEPQYPPHPSSYETRQTPLAQMPAREIRYE